jgi:glycosyltransferase involved in cell wall biosynthesis
MLIGLDASRLGGTDRTGTENYSWHLLRALMRCGPQHRFRLYSPTPLPDGWLAEGNNAETCIIPFPRLWTHVRLSAELWQRRPDLLFIPAHVMPLSCPPPAIVTVHDLGYRYFPKAHTLPARLYLDWTTHRHVRLARHLVVDSRATADDLQRFYHASPAKMTIIYPGVDPALTQVTNPAEIARSRKKYGLPARYLLYIGTIQPRKNLERLVKAFSRALPSFACTDTGDIVLVIAGSPGWLYESVFELVQSLGLEQKVIFVGYVDEEDKAPLLSGAAALVFPSLYEGFGLPVLEAMACGLPVLTSKTSSLPEVAGDAALLVDPEDEEAISAGMLRLVLDDAKREELIRRGFDQVKRFSWDSAAQALLSLIEHSRERD